MQINNLWILQIFKINFSFLASAVDPSASNNTGTYTICSVLYEKQWIYYCDTLTPLESIDALSLQYAHLTCSMTWQLQHDLPKSWFPYYLQNLLMRIIQNYLYIATALHDDAIVCSECYRAGEICTSLCECVHCLNRNKHDKHRSVAMEQTRRTRCIHIPLSPTHFSLVEGTYWLCQVAVIKM